MGDNNKIRIAGIEKESIVDGPGFRFVIFCQGCPHRCKGCHNPSTFDFEGGKEVDIKDILDEIYKNPLLQGVTFSGGEPFAQSSPLGKIAREIKKNNLDLVIFTGYKYEELLKMADESNSIKELINYCDILVDGPYEDSNRDLSLTLRGSSNQRVIDIKTTEKTGKITLVEKYM